MILKYKNKVFIFIYKKNAIQNAIPRSPYETHPYILVANRQNGQHHKAETPALEKPRPGPAPRDTLLGFCFIFF